MVDTLTKARFTMRAEVLKPGDNSPDDIDLDSYGEWKFKQDPDSGATIRVWVPYPDNPDTPDEDEAIKFGTIKCLARGIVDGGIRVAGTTERFGDLYENIDYVKLWTPPKIKLTKRDRVTNIRSKCGDILWLDEELNESNPRPTVFNVNGVTPLFDAFNKHVENFVLLERASGASAE